MSNFLQGFGGDGRIGKTIGTKAGEVVEDTVNKVMGKGGQHKDQHGGNTDQAAAGAEGEGGDQAAGHGGSDGKGGGHGLNLNKLTGGIFK